MLSKLCEKITKHKLKKFIAVSEGINPKEYHYRCILCRTRFWNYKKPKNIKE